jgi:hypothetical protein
LDDSVFPVIEGRLDLKWPGMPQKDNNFAFSGIVRFIVFTVLGTVFSASVMWLVVNFRWMIRNPLEAAKYALICGALIAAALTLYIRRRERWR